MSEYLSKSEGECLRTLVRQQNVTIGRINCETDRAKLVTLVGELMLTAHAVYEFCGVVLTRGNPQPPEPAADALPPPTSAAA